MSRRHLHPAVIAVAVAAGVVVLQSLLVALFAAPATHLAPRDLPVAVAGPDAVAEQVRSSAPGAFTVVQVSDADAADQALRDREVYAALIVGPDGPTLHTASAASPAVASLLTQAFARLGGGAPVPVTDVVPTDPDDPRGVGFAAGFMPLAMTGVLAGVVVALALRGRVARLTALVAYAVFSGVVAAAVLHGWLGVLPDGMGAQALAVGLFGLAAAGLVAGLGAVLGRAGLGLGALVVFLVGNPLSAVGAAPELLPQPWGEVGQWLPTGAGSTLLRSAAYFDWAGGGRAGAVLAGYALLGVVLIAVGRPGADGLTAAPAGEATPADEPVPA